MITTWMNKTGNKTFGSYCIKISGGHKMRKTIIAGVTAAKCIKKGGGGAGQKMK